MPNRLLPRYPIYIPSKGRSDVCLTAQRLGEDGVPFRLVVEPQERDAYAARFGADAVLTLPFRDAGSVIPARNWIKDYATAEGHERHWQLDDNIRAFYRRWRAKRIYADAGVALSTCETFADRYENVAVCGVNDIMWLPDHYPKPPFHLNGRVYSCSLILNSLPHRWRGRYNEDADLCLQVLADGWCTVLLNAFCMDKITTMVLKGGNTSALYQGDGRLKMARALERKWPGVVTTGRRYHRPQHLVKDSWRKFDTPLRRKPGAVPEGAPSDEHGIRLIQVKPEVKSARLRALLAEQGGG